MQTLLLARETGLALCAALAAPPTVTWPTRALQSVPERQFSHISGSAILPTFRLGMAVPAFLHQQVAAQEDRARLRIDSEGRSVIKLSAAIMRPRESAGR
jgi:hypothetical protein